MSCQLASKAEEDLNGRIYSREILEKAFTAWKEENPGMPITLYPSKLDPMEKRLSIDPGEIVGKVNAVDFDNGTANISLDEQRLPESVIEKIRLGKKSVGMRYIGKIPTRIKSQRVESMKIISFAI